MFPELIGRSVDIYIPGIGTLFTLVKDGVG